MTFTLAHVLILARALNFHDGVIAIVALLCLALIAWGVSTLEPQNRVTRITLIGLTGLAILVLLNLLLIYADHPIIDW